MNEDKQPASGEWTRAKNQRVFVPRRKPLRRFRHAKAYLGEGEAAVRRVGYSIEMERHNKPKVKS